MTKLSKRPRMKTRIFSALCALSMLLPILPVPAVFAATLDITSYGAAGNDTVSDSAAIQAAVDAASSGDTVLIPAGTFYLTSTVNGKSGVKITGANRDTSIIKFNSSSALTFFSMYNLTGAEVSNMTLDANNSTVPQSVVVSENGSGNKMLNLKVKDIGTSSGFGPFALYGVNTDNLTISGNIVTNIGVNSDWGGGVRVGWGSDNALIENNVIHLTGRGGIFVNDNSPGAIVRGNTVTGTGKKMEGLGIELHTNVDNSIIENNNVDHWISAVRSSYIAVRNNIVKATDGTVGNMGLEVMVDHGVTSNNLVDGGQQVGMQQSPGTGYQLWNYNTVKNIVMWGMQLQGEGTGQTEQFQYFYKNVWENGPIGHPSAAYQGYDGNAVRIHGNTKNITFDSNQIINNGRKAIEITTAGGTDRLSFVNNTITGNGGPSIDQYPSSAADLEWSGNTVSGNGTNTQLTSRGFSDPKPVANFTAPMTVQLGQSVTFTNTSTDNGTIVEHLWDLGEGLPVTTVSPTFTYQKPGTYQVILGVWDNGGRAHVKEQTITVVAGPPDTTAPSTPANLTSPAKTNTSVTLTWNASTDNVGIAGYEVYANGGLAGTTIGGSSTSYTVTGLTPNTAYSFTVKAKDTSGNMSSASSALSVTTDQTPVANWELCAGENNMCSFTGTKEVRYGAGSSFNYGTYTNGVMCSNNTFGDPAPGQYKSCFVNTASSGGGGGDTQAPTAPTGLTSPAKTSTSADLSWTASTDNVGVTGYEIYRGTTLAGTTTGATTFSATGLSPSTAYNFTVKAKDAAGNVSAASSALNVTTNAPAGDTQAPTAPTGLTSTSTTASSVSLSWTASTDNVGVTGYEIYNGSSLAGTTTGATTYTVTGLSASTAYSFTVKAKDAAGNVSAASSSVNVTTSASGGQTSTGSITREYWTNITGPTIGSIPVSTTPSGTSSLTSFQAPSNWGDNYGTRIRGYIVPTVTGTYQFSIAGDNNSVLYLSTDNTAGNKVQIGEVVDWVGELSFTSYTNQQSGQITLTAGQRYYVEVLHKEESGGDHVAVGWKTPGSSTYSVIDGAHLAPIQ
ncbi:fibronectin type III domain-containing protein [Paenibacillus sp. 2TAB19]|uniref:fibronectin type III domain-containing protein n=1 Tax=Paenibacillus sp. 2TAB19 TaxID=3233003 RepID=UPI003F9962F5